MGHNRTGHAEPPDLFIRRLRLDGDLTPDQRQKLVEIAEKCPVHKTLHRGASIETEEGVMAPDTAVEKPGAHAPERAQLAKAT